MLSLARRVLRRFGYNLREVRTNDGGLDELRLSRLIERDKADIELTIVDRVIDNRPFRFAISFRHDHIQQHHFRGELYERDELALIAQFFSGGVFVDVGANVGNHALFALKVLNADLVIAFEPGRVASTILKCNGAINDVSDRLEVHVMGLSDAPGQAKHDDWAPYNLGGARLDLGYGETMIALGDDLLFDRRVDFVKIDTEGMELSVLRGLRNTLLSKRPCVLVEVDKANEQGFFEFLGEVNYSVSTSFTRYAGMTNYIVQSICE